MNPEPTPSTPAPAASKFGVTLADVLVAGGALIILLFSWGRVVSYPGSQAACRSLGLNNCGDSTSGGSLWSYLAPLGIFVILATLGLIATAAVDTWWKRDAPMAGLHRHVVQVGLALYVLVTIFGMMLAGNGTSIGWGGIIQFVGALIAAVGAILNHFNLLQNKLELPAGGPKPTFPPGTYGQPQQPGAYEQPGAYSQQPGGYPQQPGTYGTPPQGGYAPPAQASGVDPNTPPSSADPTAQYPQQQ